MPHAAMARVREPLCRSAVGGELPLLRFIRRLGVAIVPIDPVAWFVTEIRSSASRGDRAEPNVRFRPEPDIAHR